MIPCHFKPYLVCKSETKLFFVALFSSKFIFLDCIACDRDKEGYGDNFWGEGTADFKTGSLEKRRNRGIEDGPHERMGVEV